MDKDLDLIVLGGGCFWCLDAAFKLVRGVTNVEEGYSGGSVANPSDEDIYYNNTGHAEVVRLSYDTKIISLDNILEIFWTIHDPTTINRQGPDIGTQYRSVIFYNSDAKLKIINKSLEKAQTYWDNKIVTEITKFSTFYLASDYHKDYEKNRPDYCQIIINPKLTKLRKNFSERLI